MNLAPSSFPTLTHFLTTPLVQASTKSFLELGNNLPTGYTVSFIKPAVAQLMTKAPLEACRMIFGATQTVFFKNYFFYRCIVCLQCCVNFCCTVK